MSTLTHDLPATAAELVHRLGDVSPERIRVIPPPGTATEADVVAASDRKRDGALWELIDGTLVAKDVPTASTVDHAAPVTLAHLVRRLGDVPLERIRLVPPVGTATEEDLLEASVDRLCELIDGTLVEKAVGYYESLLASVLIEILAPFVRERNLGIVLGPDAYTRFRRGNVRLPDVSFTRRDRLPQGKTPRVAVAAIPPDLAVEILSMNDSRRELALKLNDYFSSGVRLAWVVDPRARTVTVHRGEFDSVVRTESETLDGGDVLPGFELSIAEWFRRAD